MKKIFSSLAVLAMILSVFACNGNTDDGIVKGSFSGKLVYDGTGATAAWTTKSTTISLTNAKFKEIPADTEFNAFIVGKDSLELGTVTLKATAKIEAGTSGTFEISDTSVAPEDTYNDSVYLYSDFESSGTSYITPDSGKFFMGYAYINGSIEVKLKEAKATNITDAQSANATTWQSGNKITLSLTGCSFVSSLSKFDDFKVTTDGKSSDLSVSAASGSDITIKIATGSTEDSEKTLTVTIPKSALKAAENYAVPADGLTVTIKYTVTGATG